MLRIADLIPYSRNPRQHSAEQIARLAPSMKEFDWTMPVSRGEDTGPASTPRFPALGVANELTAAAIKTKHISIEHR